MTDQDTDDQSAGDVDPGLAFEVDDLIITVGPKRGPQSHDGMPYGRTERGKYRWSSYESLVIV